MAVAARNQGSKRHAIAVIGDGAMSAGMAFEALNNAGAMDADLLVVLNDNEMSISPPVGALTNYLARLLSGRMYDTAKRASEHVLKRVPGMLELARRAEEHVKGMETPSTLFEEFGFNYIGPIDGHDLDALIPMLGNIKKLRGPQFLHVITRKGHGYKLAEGAGQPPATEYWSDVISAVKKEYPDFLFMAEAYWDLEWELQQQGFDFCYDKRLYDRLEKEGPESVRLHLLADMAYQEKLVRFIENHDEPRAAAAFPSERLRAVAVAALTLPGAKLVHEGQLEGRCVRLPVFLGRRPSEASDEGLREFYLRLLKALGDDVFKAGEWRLCEGRGWPDNLSYRNLVAWCWRFKDDWRLVAVNLAARPSQGLVLLFRDELQAKSVSLANASRWAAQPEM